MSNRLKMRVANRISEYIGKSIPYSRLSMKRAMAMSLRRGDETDALGKLSNDSKVYERWGVERISLNEDGDTVDISLDREYFMKNVVEGIVDDQRPNERMTDEPKKIVVEFSSPNIAKPFHVGHLRSTIIGNFIANAHEYHDDRVVRLNYLGDWGTQFGILKIGIEKSARFDSDFSKDPIRILYDAYVHGSKLARNDASLAVRARQIFNEIEKGETKDLSDWNEYKELTVNELSRVYGRLGIKFDRYDWESSYRAEAIEPLIRDLEAKGILTVDNEGRKVAFQNESSVPVVKSDGSSLYLGRDIGAALDRYDKYKFDEMFYVVDSSQTGHFNNLKEIMKRANYPVASKCRHVGFGRIIGMSSRKGGVVFLKDILDEAKDRMRQRQETLKSTKVPLGDDDYTADILGMSAIIISDLRKSRLKNYTFSWDSILTNYIDSGSRLQYLHCRLYSIEKNCNLDIPSKFIPTLLPEEEAFKLIEKLSLFDDVVTLAKNNIEACKLVSYLFNLAHTANLTIDKLRIKGQPRDTAEQRLLLLHSTRLILKKGLEILGIQVLNRM